MQSELPRWTRGELWLTAALGAIAPAALVAWARVARAPLVDLALFRRRTYRVANRATLSFGTAFAMMFFGFFFYLTQTWPYSPPRAGLAITPGPLRVIPFAILSGRFAARHGHRSLLVGGALVYTASGLWLMGVAGLAPDYLRAWLPGLVLSGIGVGLVLPSLSAAAVSHLPAAHDAVGSAVNPATRQIGAVMGVALTVLLLGPAGLARADFSRLYGLHVALALLTALMCLPVNTRPAARR